MGVKYTRDSRDSRRETVLKLTHDPGGEAASAVKLVASNGSEFTVSYIRSRH